MLDLGFAINNRFEIHILSGYFLHKNVNILSEQVLGKPWKGVIIIEMTRCKNKQTPRG